MNKIKNIVIKTTYAVGISDIEAPNRVIEQLKKIHDNNTVLDTLVTENEAVYWLSENVNDRMAYDVKVEIIDIEI